MLNDSRLSGYSGKRIVISASGWDLIPVNSLSSSSASSVYERQNELKFLSF